MTASTILFQTINSASDPDFNKAVVFLNRCFNNKIPKNIEFDGILDLARKAVYEISTDIDFCDDKHQASIYALEWLFQELYQQNMPLERHHFFSLCKDLILPQSNGGETKEKHWYHKI